MSIDDFPDRGSLAGLAEDAETRRESGLLKKIGARFAPESVEELSEVVRETEGPIVFGVGTDGEIGWPTDFRRQMNAIATRILENSTTQTKRSEVVQAECDDLDLEMYGDLTGIELSSFDHVIEYSPQDQVVQVGASAVVPFGGSGLNSNDGKTSAADGTLRYELLKHGQCIPSHLPSVGGNADGMKDSTYCYIGRSIALNSPHCLQAQCGSWRDWILGMTIVRADGAIVKTGSKAVKNVAGYDVHKLMVGAYDTLGIVVDVTLRTFPLKALPEPEIRWGSAREKFKGEKFPGRYVWRQRVLRSCYEDAVLGAGDNLHYADSASCTLWCWLDSAEQELRRYPGDWVVRSGCGEKNVQITDPTERKLMKRTKEIFDPENRLNPGEFGFL